MIEINLFGGFSIYLRFISSFDFFPFLFVRDSHFFTITMVRVRCDNFHLAPLPSHRWGVCVCRFFYKEIIMFYFVSLIVCVVCLCLGKGGQLKVTQKKKLKTDQMGT